MSARMIVVGLTLLGLVVLALGLAEGAGGASFVGVAYCVDAPGTGSPPSGCTGTNEPSLQAALSQAAMDPAGTFDSITLPAGTFTGQFTYSNASTGGQANLSVIGQGAGSTYIDGSISDAAGLERNAVISSLTVQMPSGQNGATGVLLNGTIGSVEYVTITGADETGGEGVSIHSGEVFDASVVLSGGAHNVAVSASGENDSVYGSTLSANTALLADPGSMGASVQRSVLEGSGTGGQAALLDDAASSILQDSVLSATGGATALEAESAADVTSVTAKQLTVVGDAASTGVAALASGGTSASIAMTDSIIADPLAHSITQSVTGGSGNATVTTDYTDYDDATAPTGYVPGAHDPASYLVPGFIAPTGSTPNYRLGPTSPLLSYDTTTPSVFGYSSTDLDGLPRMTDGGRDLGAYQHQSPTVTASATPSQIAANAPSTFLAVGAIARQGDPLTYAWRFDDGTTATGESVSHAFADAGTHTATVTVTDQYGFSAAATVTVTVPGDSSVGPTNPYGCACGTVAVIKPSVSHGRLRYRRFGVPEISFALSPGTIPLRAFSVILPRGLGYASPLEPPDSELKVTSAGGRAIRVREALQHGVLRITPVVALAPGTRLAVTIQAGSVVWRSQRLKERVIAHRVRRLRATVRVFHPVGESTLKLGIVVSARLTHT